MLDADAFTKEEEEFSYAKGGVGDRLEHDIEEAQQLKRERAEVTSGEKDARSQRMQINAQVAKHLVGECNMPIKMVVPPTAEAAYRNFDKGHAKHCARQMQTSGKNYPHKPAVICAFKVRMFS